MSVNLSLLGGAGWQFFTDNGTPLAGGLLYTYLAGTSTAATTYTTSAGNVPNSNPIVLNSAGRVQTEIWLTQGVSYKFVLKTSAFITIGTYDNIDGAADPAPFYAFEAALAASSGSSLVGFIQSGSGAVATTVQAKLRESVSVLDFGAYNDGTHATETTTAITAAIASFGSFGGRVYFPTGTYLTTGITLSKLCMVFYGDGQFNTVIKGSTAGAATISLATGSAFSHWSDLTIDGGEIKDAAMITTGDTSSHTFVNVRFNGGTTTTVCWGETAGSPDVADSTFISCCIQSNNATQGQLKIRGNNTSGNHFVGGRISLGSSITGNPVDIDDGAEFSFFGTNLLGSATDYAIKAASGTIKIYGGHCESGGFMTTLVTDGRSDSTTQPHALYNVSMAVGFGSGLPSINHLANRTMIVQGGYCGNSDIVIGAGAKMIASGISMAAAVFSVNATGTLYTSNSGAKATLAGQAGEINTDVVHVRTSTSASVTGRSIYLGNTTPQPLIGINQTTSAVQLGGGTGAIDTQNNVQMPYYTVGNIGAGAAGRNGEMCVDGTNNRLVYFSGGARYYIAGTSF